VLSSVRIGGRDVLHSGLLILNDGEVARIEVSLPLGAPIATDVIRINFVCLDTPEVVNFGWKPVGDVISFEFAGKKPPAWNLALPEAMEFGSQDGRPIFFHMAYSRVSEKNVVQILVLQTAR
jgi:hypothetical protein